MKIRYAQKWSDNPLRTTVVAIAEAGLASLDSAQIIRNFINFDNQTLRAGDENFKLKPESRIVVIGIGKCAIEAASKLEDILGERITRGVVLDVRENHVCTFKKIDCVAGSHPMPSEKNIAATKKIINALAGLTADDVVLFIISGGGSTLLCLPNEGATSEDEKLILSELFRAGAPIEEINTVRKHMSFARGGFLAKYAFPAQVLSLIFSDVPGNNPEFVASGPTIKDSTTIADARLILDKYNILEKLEKRGGTRHILIETPKDEKYFAKTRNYVVASNQIALEAMVAKARELGFTPSIRDAKIAGAAKDAGVKIAEEIAAAPAGSVFLYGGETIVTASGQGRGGRNQEVALAALPKITAGTILFSLASDGRDNGPYAGAIAQIETRLMAQRNALDSEKFLSENNSSVFFEKIGDTIETGDTGSNVSDLIIAIKNFKEMKSKNVLWMENVGMDDVPEVGGKNASLGEMIKNLAPQGVRIPSGFIVTASAYRYFLQTTGLDKFIRSTLDGLDTNNLKDLEKRARTVREAIINTDLPSALQDDIATAYAEMERRYGKNVDTAVRSSATAEDLPGASFAGEHDTYLGIRGAEKVIESVKSAMASLFTARAVSYRVDKGFDHFKVALSVGVQKMIRSDKSCSGVMFTLDTESGFKDAIIINGSWGLGEMIVQGEVTPDEFIVAKKTLLTAPNPIISKKLGGKNRKMIYALGKNHANKPTKIIQTSAAEQKTFVLSDEEIKTLADWGVKIENHYSARNKKWTPMDTEWAKDGTTGELFIVQARPETVHAERDFSKIREYIRKENGKLLVSGASVGSKIACGRARVILDVKDIGQFKKGEILVTDMTDPDWEPIMKIAAAIVTDKGGRTSHAAIVSRELGIPAVVGSELATRKIKTDQIITVDTSGSDGLIFDGQLKFEIAEHDIKAIPKTKTKIMMNIATPDTAFEKSFLPNNGVGLAREEFIIASTIGIHPLALINYKKLPKTLKKKIDERTAGWSDKTEFYVDNLAYGIAKIAAAFHPEPVIVRFSDFKTNEYRTLIGGDMYEPEEENPMIGWRGASRYYDPKFSQAFQLECKAIKKVRDDMGFLNVIPMVPFCRTPEEGRKTLSIMSEGGLSNLPVYVMCEIPSNILLAEEFLEIFDGMSIGSNDLSQLILGLDRDSGIVSHVANENNPAVKKMIVEIVKKCRKRNKYIGICGQAPSDHPDFAKFLVENGIQSISLNPDTIIKTTVAIAEAEAKIISQDVKNKIG